MVTRILWSFVLIATLYVTAIFALPEWADSAGDVFGITEFNRLLRELKDGTSEDEEFFPQSLKDLNTGSGLIQQTRNVVGDIQNDVTTMAGEVQEGVNTTKTVIETKVGQVKKVGTSVEKTASAVSELKEDLTNLSNFSGSTASGSTASGKLKTSR